MIAPRPTADFEPQLVLLLYGDPNDAVTRALVEGRSKLGWPLLAVSSQQLIDGVEFGDVWTVAGRRIEPQHTAVINRLPLSDRLDAGRCVGRRPDRSPGLVEPAPRRARPVRLCVVAPHGHVDHGLLRLAARPVGRPAATGAGPAGARPFGAVAAARLARHRVCGQPLHALQPRQAARRGADGRAAGHRAARLCRCRKGAWSTWRRSAS